MGTSGLIPMAAAQLLIVLATWASASTLSQANCVDSAGSRNGPYYRVYVDMPLQRIWSDDEITYASAGNTHQNLRCAMIAAGKDGVAPYEQCNDHEKLRTQHKKKICLLEKTIK